MPFMILAFSRSHRIDPATAQKFLSRSLSYGKLPNLKDHTCTAGSAGDFYEVCERKWKGSLDKDEMGRIRVVEMTKMG